MKYLVTLLTSFVISPLFAQYHDTIEVGFDKPAYLIFDANCLFEQGSEEIIVTTPAKKVFIKAAVENFNETTVLVECENSFYLFLVRYNENPKKSFRNYQNAVIGKNRTLQKTTKKNTVKDVDIHLDHSAIAEKEKVKEIQETEDNKYKTIIDKVEQAKTTVNNRGGVLGRVTFSATKLYIKDDYVCMNISIDNSSKLAYDLDLMSFIVRDNKNKLKTTSNQDIVIEPVYVSKNIQQIKGKEKVDIIYIFNKFVLTKDKKLDIETWESNGDLKTEGGRKMSFSIFSNDLLKVSTL
jgi:hypothetical protein